MNSNVSTDILKENLKPFSRKSPEKAFIFQQDNASTRISKEPKESEPEPENKYKYVLFCKIIKVCL